MVDIFNIQTEGRESVVVKVMLLNVFDIKMKLKKHFESLTKFKVGPHVNILTLFSMDISKPYYMQSVIKVYVYKFAIIKIRLGDPISVVEIISPFL